MRVFGALFLVGVAACGSHAPTTAPLRNVGSGAATEPPIGAYACKITESGFEYPPFRCVVRLDDGQLTLEKVEGSVRFRGVIAATAGGFTFDGEVYCPWGDCTESMRATFRAEGDRYLGSFTSRQAGPPMDVVLTPAQEGYGGDGYGGDEYGGFGYGGYGYGGYGYGGAYP